MTRSLATRLTFLDIAITHWTRCCCTFGAHFIVQLSLYCYKDTRTESRVPGVDVESIRRSGVLEVVDQRGNDGSE